MLQTSKQGQKKISKPFVKFLAFTKAEGLMASYGDKFIAIDTWFIANFDSQVIKDVLGKYVNFKRCSNRAL